MGYMIEISESKVGKMSEYAEEALHAMGKVMSCLAELEEGSMGHRGGYGSRYGERGGQGGGSMGSRYGERGGYGMRDDEEWDDEEMMGERRGVRGSGRGRR